jgi:hypothetical protein
VQTFTDWELGMASSSSSIANRSLRLSVAASAAIDAGIKSELELSPIFLSFGCVSQGFIYHMPVTVTNRSHTPKMLRLSCHPVGDEPNRVNVKYQSRKLAFGVPHSFILEFEADYALNSNFTLYIEQDILPDAVMAIQVKALVVPIHVFKGNHSLYSIHRSHLLCSVPCVANHRHRKTANCLDVSRCSCSICQDVKKSLQIQKMDVYRNGVQCVGVGALSLYDERSAQTGGPTVFSEALLDDDEIENMMDLPFLNNLYWDYNAQMMRLDDRLGQVVVQPNWSLDESIAATMQARDKRSGELEDKGHYTSRIAGKTAHSMDALLKVLRISLSL